MLCCCPQGGAFCAAALKRLANVWTFIFPPLHLSTLLATSLLRSVEVWEYEHCPYILAGDYASGQDVMHQVLQTAATV